MHWHIHTAVFNNLLNPLFGNYFGSFMYGVFFLLCNGLLGYVLLKRKILYKIINQNEKKKCIHVSGYAAYVVGSSG